jgi:DNA-binding YbaB/EbfC family protein
MMFDKLKGLMDMQKKMSRIKQELDNTSFEISSSCGLVKISMNGSQVVKSVAIADLPEKNDLAKLQNAVKDAYNRATKHSQELAAQKMKEITGFDLPGLT